MLPNSSMMREMTTDLNVRPSGRSSSTLDQPLISVVIVVWNGKQYVFDCLQSLREHSANLRLEVIVVDNASTDGSPDMVAEQFPDFRLIRNAENLGFAKANNIGIEASTGDYVCLVNSDVKFTADCISPMLEYLIKHPDVGMIGPKMRLLNGKIGRSTMRFPKIWYFFCRALGLDHVFRGSRIFGGLLMADFDHETTRPVEVLNGWFVLTSRSALDKVGGFDPQFFMYGEDVDWSYRYWQAGEKLVFFADAEALHYGGASSAHEPLRFSVEMCQANWQLWRKHHGWFSNFAYLAMFALHYTVRLIGSSIEFVCRPSRRQDARFKVKRGFANLHWLVVDRVRR